MLEFPRPETAAAWFLATRKAFIDSCLDSFAAKGCTTERFWTVAAHVWWVFCLAAST